MKKNTISPKHLKLARKKMALHYGKLVLGSLCIALLACLFLHSFLSTVVFYSIQNFALSFWLTSGFMFFIVILNKQNRAKWLNHFEAQYKVERAKKGFVFIIKDEYGYVTAENLNCVRKIAKTLFNTALGVELGAEFENKSIEFYNQMILTSTEQLALYGQTIGFGNHLLKINLT